MFTMCFKEFIVVFSLIFANYVEALQLNNECQLQDGKGAGICKSTDDCEAARSVILQKKPHELGRCGFENFTEIVCCPITTPKGVMMRRTEIECNEILKNSIPPVNRVILGGEAPSLGEFPFTVALGYEEDNGIQFQCSGSIISKDYVLTVAHCLDTLQGIKPTVVRSGVIDVSDTKWNNETDVGITEYIIHPNFTRKYFYNDLALLRLSKPLQFSLTVQAVCLETNHDDPKRTLTVTAWSPTSTSGAQRRQVLQETKFAAVSPSECSETIGPNRKLNQGIVPEMLCAANPEPTRDSCRGTSGAPLLESTDKGQHRLIGVATFGKACEVDVFMRVSRYLDWIESIVWPNSLSN